MAVALAPVDSGLDFPETDDDAAFVAGRMELLIALGRLEARVDASDMRYWEVRQAIRTAGAA